MQIDNVAIVRRNGLGDLLCSYPLILYLRERYPKAKLTLFLSPTNLALTPYLPPVDQVVVLPDKGNKYWNLFKVSWRFRRKFDLAISTKTSPMRLMSCFLYWLKAEKGVAYVDHRWHGRLVNAPLLYHPEQASRAHQALKTLHLIEPSFKEVPLRLYPKLTIPEWIAKRDCPKDLPPGRRVFLSACTKRKDNRFDAKRCARIFNQLGKTRSFTLLIVGQRQDQERVQEIASHLEVPHNIYFPRHFGEFMVLIQASDLVFSGDGGTAHIAAGFGKQQVVLFGMDNPLSWAPLNPRAIVLPSYPDVNLLKDEQIYDALETFLRE